MEKMETNGEKKDDILVNYKHGWKNSGFREIQLSVSSCFGSLKFPSYL